MRDPKRIKKILKSVEKVWKKFPDYRLGQLLENIARAGGKDPHCIFHVEDDEWVKYLHEYEQSYDGGIAAAKSFKAIKKMLKSMKRRLYQNKKRRTHRRKKFTGSGYKFPECLMPGGGETGYGYSKVSKRKKPARKRKTIRKKTR